MSPSSRAKSLVHAPAEAISAASPAAVTASVAAAVPVPRLVPAPQSRPLQPVLRPFPTRTEAQPRRFARVPTHAVGVHPEQREYPRATLKLPLRLRSINHVPEDFPVTLVTRDISSTGVYFLCPKPLDAGASVELEIMLVSRPMGRGNVVLATHAHVQRSEPAATPGWFGIAASFDDVQFDRDDSVPSRFLTP
jgi:PilZ domain